MSAGSSQSDPPPAAGPARREQRAEAIEQAALLLFQRNGFDATTVEELAAAAGLGRRTFFRYFPTKQDVVLGGLDVQLDTLRRTLAAEPLSAAPLDAAHRAFCAVNDYPAAELPVLRARMRLITTVPGLAAHAALRYQAWERVIAADAAARTGRRPHDLLPSVLAKCVVAAMEAVFASWLRNPSTKLVGLIDEAFEHLAHGLAG